MRYVSTRGNAPKRTFRQIVTEGTAPDGGLYMPESWPSIRPADMCDMSFPSLAAFMLHLFAPDIPERVAHDIACDAYRDANFCRGTVPIAWISNSLALLQLSEGPTGAFKDLAMQLIARLINWELEQRGEYRNIIVATSGDTGGAAIEAFKNLSRTNLFVLWPHGRVSTIQELQMTRFKASNVFSLAIDGGTFDDCQAILKAMFSDRDFAEKHSLGGVNSLNWARIVAQITYWVWGYLRTAAFDRAVSIAIPSGNFGNAFAAYAAWRMGVPFNKIILATNENDILARTFATGVYGPKEAVIPTTSPSMDIQVASNFERLVFELFDRCPIRTSHFIEMLDSTGQATLGMSKEDLATASNMIAGTATEKKAGDLISGFWARTERVIDPHTAVAMYVGGNFMRTRNLQDILVVAETAQAWKFPETMKKIIGTELDLPDRWFAVSHDPARHIVCANTIDAVKRMITEHAL